MNACKRRELDIFPISRMETIDDSYQDTVTGTTSACKTGEFCQVGPLWKTGTIKFAIKPLNDVIMIVILDHDNSRTCNLYAYTIKINQTKWASTRYVSNYQ